VASKPASPVRNARRPNSGDMGTALVIDADLAGHWPATQAGPPADLQGIWDGPHESPA
jgi:hypothetical protein